MRHIRTQYAHPPAEWEEKAKAARIEIQAAAVALQNASPGEAEQRRNELSKKINSYRALWNECKQALGELSGKKCWYCESHEKRSHMAVDHFRPKAEVKDCDGHLGYWWLALSFDNFRYSCTYCNSLLKDPDGGPTCGKGTAFPLLNPDARAHGAAGIPGEQPILLDPTRAGDCRLLWFNDEGRAVPRLKETSASNGFRRAKESIVIYNLNEVDTVEARYAIYQDIGRLVKRANRWYTVLGVDPRAEEEYDEALAEIVCMASEEAEFSSAARAAFSGHRDLEWADEVWQIL
jgi:hypothetical protein